MPDSGAVKLSKMMREEAEMLRADIRRRIAERRRIAAAMQDAAELSRDRLAKSISERDKPKPALRQG